ncbi:MAG: rod shape-determining protein MreD [Thermoleophilia bacterium]|nr:rod shape-determining protein MreD [Thermoleophilia bacterium]
MISAARATALVFVAAIAQVAVFSGIDLLATTPDVLLVVVVAVAFARGALFGSVAGFFGGLVVDTATLGVLGVTSLLLTLAGFWAGRYAETTGRGRPFAPYLAVGVMAVLVTAGGIVVHYLLGDGVDLRGIGAGIVPTVVLDVALAVLLVPVSRRVIGTPRLDRAREVEVVV